MTTAKAKAKAKAKVEVAAAPAPNERDKAAVDRANVRVLARHKRAAVKVVGQGTTIDVASPHADASGHFRQLLDAFGTPSADFMNATFGQLVDAIANKAGEAPNELAINAALAVMGGADPANEVEALLASQMAATHGLAMVMIGRARRVGDLNQLEVQGGLAVKLLRTFTLQAETLAKLRRGGGQTVRVEHVHVHAGAQAIVGNVAHGGGAISKNEEQPHAKQFAAAVPALECVAEVGHAPFDALRSAHPARDPVPIARHA